MQAYFWVRLSQVVLFWFLYRSSSWPIISNHSVEENVCNSLFTPNNVFLTSISWSHPQSQVNLCWMTCQITRKVLLLQDASFKMRRNKLKSLSVLLFSFFPHTVSCHRPDWTPPMAVFDPLAVSLTPLGYLHGGWLL